MKKHRDYRFAILLQGLFVAPLGCLEPTQALVEITTDVSCSHIESTGISAGLLSDIDTGPYDTTTSLCSDGGEIGSIVLVPPEEADKNSPFAFKVVGSLGVGVEACKAPEYGPGCIVAQRAMRFVPQRPFRVPIHIGRACAGVVCPELQTCADGICRSQTIDPYDCDGEQSCALEGKDAPSWQKGITGQGLQMARHIATSDDGTLIATGAFDDKLELGGKQLVSKGSTDVFLAAFSQGGLHKWSFSFGGPRLDDSSRVAVGPDGSVFVMIGFQDTIDLGGGELLSAGNYDIALAKFTYFGKLEWGIRFGGPATELPSGLIVDHDGNVYASGSFSESAKVGGQTITSNGATDAFVVKFDPTGNVLWTKAIGGPLEDGGSAVGVDAKGQVYVTGYIAGDVAFGPNASITALAQSDAFVASYDAGGKFRWVKSVGTQINDRIADVAVREDRIMLTGTIGGAGEIAGKPMDAGDGRGIVAAFEPAGQLVWMQRFGGMPAGEAGNGEGKSVAIASDGSVVVGGDIIGTTVFGSEPAILGGSVHPFVAVLERDGKPRWAQVISSSSYGATSAVAAASNGFAYISGWFVGDLEIGKKYLTSGGAEDGFLLRVAQPPPPDTMPN